MTTATSVPFIGLVGLWLLIWRLRLWFALKIIDNSSPYTFDTVNMRLAGLEVLIHVVQHLVSPPQSLTLTDQLL